MNSLKKILTVMVITLVVIVVAGGLYVASMGNMNHGAPQLAASDQKDKAKEPQNTQNTQNIAQNNNTSNKMNQGNNGQTPSGSVGQVGPVTNNQGQADSLPAPVIIQVPPPAAKTDTSLYIEQLKARLKSINEANSSIAANSSGQSMVMQQNGSAVSSGQSGMNELHQGFYKLGQDVSSMEKTLDDLASEIKEDQPIGQNPVQTVIPGYSNGYPQNMAPYYSQYYPAYPQYQSPITQTPSQSEQQSNLNGTNQTMNHSSLSGKFLNANVVKVIFAAILIFSIIFGVISLVGFIGSLFKPEKSDGRGTVQI